MQQITNADDAMAFNKRLLANMKNFLDLLADEFMDHNFHFQLLGQWNGEDNDVEMGYSLDMSAAFMAVPTEESTYYEGRLLHAEISYIDQQVQVKEIKQPLFMKEVGITMKLLHILQQTAAQVGYALITDMDGEGLNKALVQRGAVHCGVESLDGRPVENHDALFIPPNVQLLDRFDSVLERLVRRYVSALEERYPQEGLSYRVWSNELEDGRWAIGIDGMRQKDQAAEPEMDFVMLRMYIHWESRQIYIANLYLPPHMRHKNVGKELIFHIFKIAELELAQVYLVDMVPSFYQRMLNRGAERCCRYEGEKLVESDDILRITRNTRLV